MSGVILWGNQTPTGDAPQLTGTVDVQYSIVAGGQAGTGNLSTEPEFEDPNQLDYHLTSDSAGIDSADPAGLVANDFDDDSRPQGAGYDIGADEVVP